MRETFLDAGQWEQAVMQRFEDCRWVSINRIRCEPSREFVAWGNNFPNGMGSYGWLQLDSRVARQKFSKLLKGEPRLIHLGPRSSLESHLGRGEARVIADRERVVKEWDAELRTYLKALAGRKGSRDPVLRRKHLSREVFKPMLRINAPADAENVLDLAAGKQQAGEPSRDLVRELVGAEGLERYVQQRKSDIYPAVMALIEIGRCDRGPEVRRKGDIWLATDRVTILWALCTDGAGVPHLKRSTLESVIDR